MARYGGMHSRPVASRPDGGSILRLAEFDPTGRYRYCLRREWRTGCGRVAFIMLNPSTADRERDDPTIRRCMAFATRWGFAALDVVNLFAFRATRVADLRLAEMRFGRDWIVGPENDAHLISVVAATDCTVAAWGAQDWAAARIQAVAERLAGAPSGSRLHCLGRTRGGHPRHPLYVRRVARRRRFAIVRPAT